MRKLILFLVRRKLGVKKLQAFRFVNQNSPMNWYIFDKNSVLWKVEYHDNNMTQIRKRSRVSLNWITDKECEINICDDQAYCITVYNTLAMGKILTSQELLG